MTEPTVIFNMDLANGHTSARFCYEAASVLGEELSLSDQTNLVDPWGEYVGEIVDEWTQKLEETGYMYVWWNAGDVVVYDLRGMSEEDVEDFYKEMENM
jgi:hypothetical protein